MTMRFSALTKEELGAIIICVEALLRGSKQGSLFAIKPADYEREGFQQMLVHLESGCDKLLKILEGSSPNFKPNNN